MRLFQIVDYLQRKREEISSALTSYAEHYQAVTGIKSQHFDNTPVQSSASFERVSENVSRLVDEEYSLAVLTVKTETVWRMFLRVSKTVPVDTRAVLLCIISGMSYREVSDLLFISKSAVARIKAEAENMEVELQS